ncbi:hypothetical protein CH249_01880 [Rhodococcus sp. 05-2255-3B1]|uniref:hypothetical protein n=1 Tax=unclassified Rhodococcus (in: high G+C Gram-positive bacteria) TaxID=192944 RepID=UPI000B9A2D73|nr:MULTISPECIES: hypothetical protein [unclassified Rhodococcus (in: high G+C Gram-positive bacteria)]OZE13367.1 hypothetical protein CH250_05485 [Rhodococcus sp. 05-2255-3C]OZE16021.1 hypothetical protein CH249_01880 [Rhodococcus sp. 05-2255-3B1]OZE19061.1 hypothetical protein CH255_13905 [Rhodococcus sp. 05-2255-2A2]
MAGNHGGARNNSGPTRDPNSERSESLGIKYLLLPAAGWKGRAPKWPLEGQSDREKVVWREVWKTPQAKVWSEEKLWRLRTIAMFVRWSVRAEQPDCSASILTQVNRLADQLGLTPAGMLQNGWKIATDEVGAARERAKAAAASADLQPLQPQPRRSLAGLDGGA